MAKTFNRMRIDVNEKPNSICINPVQNDTQSRYLDVSLYNNGLPIDLTGEVVRINFKKEGGTTFFNQGEITNAAEGRCQFALTNEVLSEAKTLKAQISIWSGEGEILSTQVFLIRVTESIRNDEEVESTNEFGVLVVLFQEIQNSLDLMQTIAENFGEPGEKAAEFEAETFWQMLEVLASRADTKGIVENITKIALNSTFDTSYLTPLDMLLSAKIVCRGTIGTKFTLTRTDGYYPEMTAEITENSLALPNDLYAVIVPVPCGSYSIEIDVFGTIITTTVNASGIGQHYTFGYSSYTLLQEFNSNGTFIVPDGVSEVFVDAAGGGGGGGGAGYAGGGGGGGAYFLTKQGYEVTPRENILIEIGLGGVGGDEYSDGTSGKSTVIGTLVTLAGGNGGNSTAGHNSAINANDGGSGGSGRTSGGRGGIGTNGSTSSTPGKGGYGGDVGKSGEKGGNGKGIDGDYKSAGGGGGGGGSFAKGGNGGDGSVSGSGNDGRSGRLGSGGGGGGGALGARKHGRGGGGGNGFVKIYKGVQVI